MRRERDSGRTAEALKFSKSTEEGIDLSMPGTPHHRPHKCYAGLVHKSICLVVHHTPEGKSSDLTCI